MSSIIFVRNGVIKGVPYLRALKSRPIPDPRNNTLDQSTLRRCRSLLRRSRPVQRPLCYTKYISHPGRRAAASATPQFASHWHLYEGGGRPNNNRVTTLQAGIGTRLRNAAKRRGMSP